MKVVGQDSRYTKLITCTNCASRLEYVKRDIMKTHPKSTMYHIICSCCNNKILVEEWKIDE